MTEKLRFIQYLEKNGCSASIVSIDHLEELGADVRSLHDKGFLDDKFYDEYAKTFFTPELPKRLQKAKSIIVLSIPQPMIRTTFHWKGETMHFIVPPTYYDFYRIYRRVRPLLDEAFRPKHYKFIRANLPVKTLAVRSGLALYGRNNITYVPKYGSFHRLMAFYTDYDSPVDNWQEKKALSLCDKCKACLNACPTGAIHEDRFLLHAEKCLPFFNEKDSKNKFPKWIDGSAHNSMIGCMLCQKACPYDKNVIGWYEDRGSFSEDETEYLLKGKFSGNKAKRIQKKLKKIGLDLTIFPRNLEILLNKRNE